MALPMLVLAAALGLGGAWAIEAMVESVNDRILGAASRAIAESLKVEDGQITLELSPAIFGMLENSERDNVYYSVRHRGQVLTGYGDLPSVAPPVMADTQVVFGKGVYLGRPVRIVAEARSLPQIPSPVIVEVAETLDARDRTTNRMLVALALLELILIGFAAVLLPLAVRWGLRPLREVRREMRRRAASDLAPLKLHAVPRELHSLVRAFNTMLERVDEAAQRMRRFTADASHQMRTPLAVLRTHVDLLRDASPGSVEAASALVDIDEASNRLSHLLVQLLALARADAAGPGQVPLKPVDLNALAAEAAASQALAAVRAKVELSFAPAATAAEAFGHPDLVHELVANLVDNAVRYNRPGGTVQVGVELADGEALVVVEDDGPGIAPQDRERAMTRFTRLPSSQKLSGSGLGLPIARSLAQAIGAELRLETASSGKGLRAEVRFARAAAATL